MYIHKCFKPSKCLPLGRARAELRMCTDSCAADRLEMVPFFFSLTKADSIVPMS